MIARPLIVSLCLGAALSARTLVVPIAYSDLLRSSDRIFVGTVKGKISKLEERGQTIRTYVRFTNLSILRGKGSKEIVLRLEGGTVGEDSLRIPGMPQFVVGGRYLVYESENGKGFSPIAGFHQGVFRIEERRGRQVLIGHNGLELIGVEKDRFVFACKPAKPAQKVTVKVTPAFRPAQSNAARLEKLWIRRQRIKEARRLPAQLPSLRRAASPTQSPRRGVKSRGDRALRRPQPLVPHPPILVPSKQDRGVRISVKALLSLAKTAR